MTMDRLVITDNQNAFTQYDIAGKIFRVSYIFKHFFLGTVVSRTIRPVDILA
jgi:hypothetical protein